MYLLYNLVLWIASPALALWMACRALQGRLPGLAERFGVGPLPATEDGRTVVWLHAVSLGEMKVALAIAESLRARVQEMRFVFTASTRTGHEQALRRARPGDTVCYPPIDLPWVCRRFLKRHRPNLVVVLETELWPNLFREAKRFGAGLVLANGRISDRSWPRYRRTKFLWTKVLPLADAVYAQSPGDADRLMALGLPANRLRLSGNLKYAILPAAAPITESLSQAVRAVGLGPVLVAGSTMPGEEAKVLEAFLILRQEFPSLWMILAPRHPERCAEIAAQLRSAGIALVQRSRWHHGQPLSPGVFLLDTTGELAALYELADAAFIGGTLVPTGGHNILEPAHFACPTIMGPSMENFREIAGEFLRAGAVIQVQDSSELSATLRRLFLNPPEAARLGQAARELLGKQAGGFSPLLDELGNWLESAADNAAETSVGSHAAAASAAQWK